MKNPRISLMAIAIITGTCAALNTKASGTSEFAGLYWYEVDASDKTVGAPVFSNDTKAQVLAEPDQVCDDSGTTICLFGSTNGDLTNGTSAAGADFDHRVNNPDQ